MPLRRRCPRWPHRELLSAKSPRGARGDAVAVFYRRHRWRRVPAIGGRERDAGRRRPTWPLRRSPRPRSGRSATSRRARAPRRGWLGLRAGTLWANVSPFRRVVQHGARLRCGFELLEVDDAGSGANSRPAGVLGSGRVEPRLELFRVTSAIRRSRRRVLMQRSHLAYRPRRQWGARSRVVLKAR